MNDSMDTVSGPLTPPPILFKVRIIDELVFWYLTIGSGGDWQQTWKSRFQADTEFQYSQYLPPPRNDPYQALDVGAGAITQLGRTFRGRQIDVVATDALVPGFNQIFKDLGSTLGITSPHKNVHCDAERLTEVFKEGSFDFIIASDCIDHCYDPKTALSSMFKVLRHDGTIVLGHYENVAEIENYHGLHQWNLAVEDGRFCVWNKNSKFFAQDIFDKPHRIEIIRDPNAPTWFTAIIRHEINT